MITCGNQVCISGKQPILMQVIHRIGMMEKVLFRLDTIYQIVLVALTMVMDIQLVICI